MTSNHNQAELVRRLAILVGDLVEFGKHDAACPAVHYANEEICCCGFTAARRHAADWLAEESVKVMES